MNDFLFLIALSLLTSIFTTWLVIFTFRWYIQKYLKSKLQELFPKIVEEFKLQLQQAFVQSAKELLPEFKKEIKKSFKEAIDETLTPKVLEEISQSITSTALGVFQNSWNFFLGKGDENKK
ncbi:MAG: hypothetical protein NZ853_01070 [Leptospiraceae bacterium]|nr:hypothetical protein [Leptospiraceae bacterium]MDW7976180.1 hypothetical protein [Leptospiraceae bacterium]